MTTAAPIEETYRGPKGSPRVRLTFDVPPELRAAARIEAYRRDVSTREYLTEIVAKAVAEDTGVEEESLK